MQICRFASFHHFSHCWSAPITVICERARTGLRVECPGDMKTFTDVVTDNYHGFRLRSMQPVRQMGCYVNRATGPQYIRRSFRRVAQRGLTVITNQTIICHLLRIWAVTFGQTRSKWSAYGVSELSQGQNPHTPENNCSLGRVGSCMSPQSCRISLA